MKERHDSSGVSSSQETNPVIVPATHATSRLRRVALGSMALIGALLLAAGLLTPFASAPTAKALPQNTANVIVQFDDHARVIREVNFTDPISGMKALEMSDLSVVISDTSFGPLVCSIEGVGCPRENCFCGGSAFWGYSYFDGTAWQSYPVGANSSVISQTGAIEGWRWGEWGSALASPAPAQAADRALNWLSARQVITSGGFGNSMGASVEGMLAFAANHVPAREVQRGEGNPSLFDYAAVNGAAYSQSSPAAAGKLAAALVGGEACLAAGAVLPSAHFSPTLGAYGEGTGENAWAILGVYAVSETVESDALITLQDAQQADGGWEWSPGWGSDTNSTALAVQALIAGGEEITSTVIVSAVAYLKGAQSADGGFPYAADPASNGDANSTAYVVQALIAAGENPDGAAWEQGGVTPVAFLMSLQLPSGAFEWTAGTGENALATTQAVPALLGRVNPFARGAVTFCPVQFLPAVQGGVEGVAVPERVPERVAVVD